MNTEPIVLLGENIVLEPLTVALHAQLCAVGLDADLVKWTESYPLTPDGIYQYIQAALALQAQGIVIPFAVIHKSSNNAIGSTRFAAIDRKNRRLEIGWTWVAKAWQRTAVNTEAKYLLLRHAFEVMKCMRVEFKTSSLNEKSRKAILRIGAKEEGIFRKHLLMPSGYARDTVYFSIIDDEWPAVKSRLEGFLKR